LLELFKRVTSKLSTMVGSVTTWEHWVFVGKVSVTESVFSKVVRLREEGVMVAVLRGVGVVDVWGERVHV